MAFSNEHWMWRCLALSRRALGQTQPNPLVGCIVLDKNGKKVGQGHHHKAGQAHAEVLALQAAGTKAKGGTLLVSLEPCCVQGRTGPCTEVILKYGIKKVICALRDPNPKVAGQGLDKLRQHSIHIEEGVLSLKALRLNAPFFKWIQTGLPWVTAKVALSKDGFLGSRRQQLWISDPACRHTTMKLRAEAGAIVVGVQTVLVDDPQLTVRGTYAQRKPLRIILDPDLAFPMQAQMLKNGEKNGDGGPIVLISRAEKLSGDKAKQLRSFGVLLWDVEHTDQGFDLRALLQRLGKMGITAILAEGGAATLKALEEQDLVDRWVIYQSRRSLGEGPDKLAFAPKVPFPNGENSAIERGQDTELWYWKGSL